MKFYLLSTGLYEERDVRGVYATAEAAMAAQPKGVWTQRDDGDWENDLDWEDFAEVNEWSVRSA